MIGTSRDGAALVPRSRGGTCERAWIIANESYGQPNGEVYRAYARELYDEFHEEMVHRRLESLLAQLDRQNEQLDSVRITPVASLEVKGE